MKFNLEKFRKLELSSENKSQTFGGCSYEPTKHSGTCKVISTIGGPDRYIPDTHDDTKHIPCDGSKSPIGIGR